jgi:alpha-beta hydrolase superfamily lysophospholipase
MAASEHALASLVQDVWLGSDPRLRARRLAPYEAAAVRVVFQPDLGATLDDPPVSAFLETLAARVEVIAYEPRGQGGSGGGFGPPVLDDLRRLLVDLPSRWHRGLRPVVAGHGLGAWLALAVADTPGLAGVLALGPVPRVPAVLEAARAASPPPDLPALVMDGRDQDPGELGPLAEWVARNPLASRVSVPGDHAAPLLPPWSEMAASWAAGRAAPR